MKKTKIICTLGPASETEEVISAMADMTSSVSEAGPRVQIILVFFIESLLDKEYKFSRFEITFIILS